jgi:two-component system LytT family response regulator
VTAFDNYAVRAFEVHAHDYLLKPVDPERLVEVLARARQPGTIEVPPTSPRYTDGDLFFHNSSRHPRFVRIREIAFIRAAGNYSELHTNRGPPLLESRTLATWEMQLGTSFVRVHRSVLVNLDFIERIVRSTNYTYEIYLRGRTAPIPMSRRRALKLKRRQVLSLCLPDLVGSE